MLKLLNVDGGWADELVEGVDKSNLGVGGAVGVVLAPKQRNGEVVCCGEFGTEERHYDGRRDCYVLEGFINYGDECMYLMM